MGHSIRSKIKKRLRTAKRQRIDAMIVTPRLKDHHEALTRVAQGRTIETRKPKNAFLYPKAPDAVFPQHEIMKPIDFRAQNLPMAGYAFRGNRRKYDAEQTEYMKQVATAMHPKVERLAGGGAILASSGQRVSIKDAELIAAAVQCAPGSDPLSAASAVAAAVAQAAAPGPAGGAGAPAAPEAPAAASAPVLESTPQGEADTSRRPVLKDARRQQRKAEHRPRPNSIKKKGKRSAAAAPAEEPAAAPAPQAAAAGVAAQQAKPAPAQPGTIGAAASDGDVEMKPASGSGQVTKVKKKGKQKTKAA